MAEKQSSAFIDRILEPIDRKRTEIQSFYDQLADQTRLLGYVMELGYDDAVLVTNDFYKIRSGGISKNSFLLIRPESLQDMIASDDFESLDEVVSQPAHLILARVREPAPTPLANDVARTYFEMHKSHMPELDVFTKSELQWGAIRVSILGTFFDDQDFGEIEFGGDIQTFLSPHMYSVHVPTPTMLERLINFNVDRQPMQREIGNIRLTESLVARPVVKNRIPVRVAPSDFVGARTALFGKTRMGKSNTVKVIAEMILDSGANVGQVIFDLNGEYAYTNPQDNTSIFEMYRNRCERYTLRPNPESGVRTLKADFFQDLPLGHQIMRDLFTQEQGSPPDYMKSFFDFEIMSTGDLRSLTASDAAAAVRYRRAESIYKCVLRKANFECERKYTVKLEMKQDLRKRIADELQRDSFDDTVPVDDAVEYYEKLWEIYDPAVSLFNSKGKEYLDEVSKSMLTMLTGKKQGGAMVSGFKKLVPFRRYHSFGTGQLLDDIVKSVKSGKTVIIDLSNAPQELTKFFGDLVSRAIFQKQMESFTSNSLGDQFVQFYFEEAHNLFPKDDRDLTSIYNRLAKEGAKLNIGLIYSTQSIESLSPDLLKNTENFFIAHLNDDREIKALTRFHEFRDVGADVQRTRARGFVRAITRSHKFALPLQIRKFGPKGA